MEKLNLRQKKQWVVHKVYETYAHPRFGDRKIGLETHIYPTEDRYVHETKDDCWCRPEVELHPRDLPRYIHNAADDRELIKCMERMRTA